jgi:hypothetical protein
VAEPERRWDTDQRLRGVADASAIAPYVDELRDLVTTPDWIAEDPEAHLLPHIERFTAQEPRVRLVATRVSSGAFELDLEVGRDLSRGAIRELAYRVVAAIAEGVTLVRQVGDAGDPTFEAVTGMPPGTAFATHGHTLRIRIRQRPSDD